jgi:polyisoprenoid-binding protein YceI
MDAAGPATVRLDARNARVSFRVRWFGVIQVRGTFEAVDARITVPSGGDPCIVVDVESASVRTGIGLRDRHLRGFRFLDSQRHPIIRFESDRVVRQAGMRVTGRLSLRGLTRTVEASVRNQSSNGVDGHLVATFSVPRRPHQIGTASGIRALNPLLWAIGDDVAMTVELTVPATIAQAAALVPAR